MTAPRIIPPAVRRRQIEAADPDVSAFVSANAGAGKTHVLAQRVINLLLRGCDPAKILCITFTKAAAANMANRVFGTLAEWTALSDAALDEKIALSTGREPAFADRARARRLFASALETPGGLKVQTIHAFCTRLLHQFPFEADVAARFDVLDEATTKEMLERLTLEVLLQASAAPDSALGRALATAIVAAADTTFKSVIGDAIKKRDALTAWIARAGSIDAAMAELSHTLGIEPDQTLAEVDAAFFNESLIAGSEWNSIASALEEGSKSDKEQGARFRALATLSGTEQIEKYLDIFCTGKRDKIRDRLATKSIQDGHPALCQRLTNECTRVWELVLRKRAVESRERTRALVMIADDVIRRYKAEKEQRALLDYEDLIAKTLPLLQDGASAWVHYKLDLGIDHMLIDEAQDTSPQQWEIIKLLASEFAPGGARDVRRTIFAVGDEKQSIFSFQGAAPKAFDEMRHLFERQFNVPEMGWRYVRFHHSFRSGAAVLGSVDQVFAAREIYQSVTTDAVGIPEHLSLPGAAPGLVELWPLIAAADKKEMEGWDAPFDTESEESPRVKLARRIATHVVRWMERGLKAGEVLVLVRQRGPLFEAIIRALKNAEVPVAGADRLVLTEHIAVMDLLALADSLLLPEDDLALACTLKSPLFGLSEEQLFALAWNRKGSLRDSLRAKAADNSAFAETERALAELARLAREKTPFAFFAHVLGARGGRKNFLARLGPEANDALDEFLNFALDYEARETPSLQGFVNWLRAAESEVKRDMEMTRDEVRVMTAHGAKGLEANTVILADTTTEPNGKPPKLLTLAGDTLVWAKAKQDDSDVMANARGAAENAARDEYRRLLYVAMTRAAERLIVCGTQGAKKIPDGCWYDIVHAALRDRCVEEEADDGDGEVLRYRKGEAQPGAASERQTSKPSKAAALPCWLSRKAEAEHPAVRTIRPSSAEEDGARPAPSAGASAALKRGSLVHRLMQSLPDIPAERRASAAADYLSRAGSDLPPEERAKLAIQVMRILDDARFRALFAPGSRTEVPIIGKLDIAGREVRVSGQIDRLAVTPEAVLIADYKTNRPPPSRIGEVPPAYLRQLALYRAVLARLYPGRAVRAALIWTEVPDLMELPAEVLDAALAQVKPA